jgi:hypothetical protein
MVSEYQGLEDWRLAEPFSATGCLLYRILANYCATSYVISIFTKATGS